jgi:hypothetical protein
MTTVTTDQLFRKIDVGEYKTAIIYDRYFTNIPNNLAYFERYDAEEVEELKTNMRDFVAQYSGGYSIVLKKAKGGNIATSCLCRVNLIPEAVPGQPQQVQGNNFEDPIKMKQRILEELKTEMRTTMLQATVDQQAARLAELNTTSGRMGLMIENFIMAKMGKAAPMFQNQPLQGTVEIENDETEVDDETFVENLTTIKNKFGTANLMKIAKKIEQGDPQIEMIINILSNE